MDSTQPSRTLQPEIFESLAGYTHELLNSNEVVDLSTFTSFVDSNDEGMDENDPLNSFGFGSGFDSTSGPGTRSVNLDYINHAVKSIIYCMKQKRGFSIPRLNKMFNHHDGAHVECHTHRLNSLTGTDVYLRPFFDELD